MHRSFALVVLAACGSHAATMADGPTPAIDAPAPDAFAEVPHRAFPQVTSNGGQLLGSMRLVVVTAPGDPLAGQLAQFCQTLVTSQWWTRVTSAYGVGAARGCVSLVGPAITAPATLDDTALTQYIASAVAAAANPPMPDGETMYLLYLPPGVQFAGNGTAATAGTTCRTARWATAGGW